MADLLPASLMPSVLLSVASTSPLMSTDAASSPTHNLSLHDALPISAAAPQDCRQHWRPLKPALASRSEEHTSELQSHSDIVCRLLLDKKNRNIKALNG